MTTPRDILVAAFGYSSKNDPAQIVNRQDELFDVVMDAMNGIYAFAAEVNPEFFAKTAAVGLSGGAWLHPADAECVFYMEAGGREVVVVPVDQKDADLARPAVYKQGRSYFSAGNTLDPAAGNITFHYSQVPTRPATIDTAFDASWPTTQNRLLTLETAIYLSLSDGRAEEAAALIDPRDRAARRFVARLEHENVNIVRARGGARVYNVPNLIQSLLAQVPT